MNEDQSRHATVEGAMAGNKWALAVAAGAITTTLVGGVALAGFQPFATSEQNTRTGPVAGLVERDQPRNMLKAALDRLVAKGTITRDQEDAILQALKDAAPAAKPKPPVRPGMPSVRSFISDLTRAASTYLGLSEKELALQLRSGKSIADVANGLAAQGKSAPGLTVLLTKTANDKVDQAVAANKLTADQAAALKPRIAAEIKAFVERSHTRPAPRPAAPLKPTPSPKP
jgi:polyhydroxyalkanoate synthesis regulator phasin